MRLIDLAAEILRHILIDDLGEKLLVHADGKSYVHLLTVCKRFHAILSDKPFRKRMMQCMAEAFHGRLPFWWHT